MKRNINKIFIFVFTITFMFTLVGCSNTKTENPEDAIKNAYGDTQFRISFDSTTLENPITDIFYTANNMPVLPNPTKVGFVFAGWYFDASCTKPCDVQSGDLLWKMKDLTLYPKWEEEQIVNKGTYDIEYNAKIIDDSIAMGPLAEKYGYQKFPDNIIASETYIEKNDKGTFLRIQYDNVVRGPVLGGDMVDDNNFSKMTYTITDRDRRINKDISILDRTNNIQTIYYDLNGLKLTDTIILYVDYYNWSKEINDNDRNKASVAYKVEFNITKFIGFGQAFVNTERRLEDGIYLVPTHYQTLSKEMSILDMFNPVYAYIEARGGNYRLYKPMNTYNNDFPEVTPEQYPLRTSGYAREFACMYIDKDKKIDKDIEEDKSGKYYLPEEIGADRYIPLTYEFHADTGRYYYSVDLGNSLDKDLIFIGGSAGAMEQMFSFAFDYRRLLLEYNSMVRVAEWDYKPLSGDEYIFKDKVAFYPGSVADFANANTDYDIYQTYRQAINMTNVFFVRTSNGVKVFDTKMTIAPSDDTYNYPMGTRYRHAKFDISYSAFGYDPKYDGELYGRDLAFINNSAYRHTNSFVNSKRIGQTFNYGDTVSLPKIYQDKVVDDRIEYEYQAYVVDDNLNVDFNNKINVSDTFRFSRNMAVMFTSNDLHKRNTLVYIMEKKIPELTIEDENIDIIWNKNNEGIYTTTQRFAMGQSADPIIVPNVTYTYYGVEYSMKDLRKYDSSNDTYSDFTKISAWEYSHGKYRAANMICGSPSDFIMSSEKMRVLMQLPNPFNEFDIIEFEYKGKQAGEYSIKVSDEILSSGDTKYKGDVRNKISYQMYETFNIVDSLDINNIPSKFVLNINNDEGLVSEDLLFTSAIIYMQDNTVTVNSIDDIWSTINGTKYALIHMYYNDSYGDSVMYKAQYNFKLNSHTIDDYYFVDDSRSIFTDDNFKIRNPIITSSDYNNISYGSFLMYKKNGNNYELASEEDVRSYSDEFSVNMHIYKSGDYLIVWEYELYRDEQGRFVFKANSIDDTIGVLKFNVCQRIKVVDKNADMKVTYVTDVNHPFDKISLEDKGYSISEDAQYQYATILIKTNNRVFALTQDAFIKFDSTDPRSKDILFVWTDKNGIRIVRPGYMLDGINSKMGSINPVIYAEWDSGVTLDVYSDTYGSIKKESTRDLIKNPSTGADYLVFFSNLTVDVPNGYVLYGWKASKAIFTKEVMINGVKHTVPSNFRKGGYTGSVMITEKVDFTAVLKKSAYISYEAYDEDLSSKVDFKKPLRTDYGIFMGDTFNDVISDAKLKEITKVKIADTSKLLKRWEIYDNVKNEYVTIDLKTLVIDRKYLNANGKAILRAVFG